MELLCRRTSRYGNHPPNRAGPPEPALPPVPLPAPRPPAPPNSEARPPPPLAPTLMDSALTAPSEPLAPRTTTVSPGWMPWRSALTVLVIEEAGEVVTLTVLPSVLVTYSVLPLM